MGFLLGKGRIATTRSLISSGFGRKIKDKQRCAAGLSNRPYISYHPPHVNAQSPNIHHFNFESLLSTFDVKSVKPSQMFDWIIQRVRPAPCRFLIIIRSMAVLQRRPKQMQQELSILVSFLTGCVICFALGKSHRAPITHDLRALAHGEVIVDPRSLKRGLPHRSSMTR